MMTASTVAKPDLSVIEGRAPSVGRQFLDLKGGFGSDRGGDVGPVGGRARFVRLVGRMVHARPLRMKVRSGESRRSGRRQTKLVATE